MAAAPARASGQTALVDASTSDHLVAVRRLEGGDWILRLHTDPKDKPLPSGRERVWAWALWDTCTGLTALRYTVATGESAQDGLDFLLWAWSGGRASLPDDLWMDSGPLRQSRAAMDLLGRLGVAAVLDRPHTPARMRGVERSRRTRLSRFERALFLNTDLLLRTLRFDDAEELLLSDLNRGQAAKQ